jgi:hypothetical protein
MFLRMRAWQESEVASLSRAPSWCSAQWSFDCPSSYLLRWRLHRHNICCAIAVTDKSYELCLRVCNYGMLPSTRLVRGCGSRFDTSPLLANTHSVVSMSSYNTRCTNTSITELLIAALRIPGSCTHGITRNASLHVYGSSDWYILLATHGASDAYHYTCLYC